jgi:hypothetical protein
MKLPYKSGTVELTSKFGLRWFGGGFEGHKGIDLVGTNKVLTAPCDGVIGSSTIITDTSNRTWE